MLEVSNNSTSIMRSCQKKYEWTYIYGLKPVKRSTALSLGSVIHEVFDLYYKGSTKDECLQHIVDVMDGQIANCAPEEAEDLMIVKYILRGMWLSYPFRVDVFSKIFSEIEFKVKVPGTRGILFVGKVDGIVVDPVGKMWVRELKTTSTTFSQFEVRSRRASQGTGYIWAMRKLGYPVEGIVYDYVKKPLLRKGVNEDVTAYGNRIISDYTNRPDIYYKRHYSYRTAEDLELFEEDLRRCAYDIRRAAKRSTFHRNPEQCYNYNTECPYLKICFQRVPDPLTVQLYYNQSPTVSKGGV